jgi:hypothetical protein
MIASLRQTRKLRAADPDATPRYFVILCGSLLSPFPLSPTEPVMLNEERGKIPGDALPRVALSDSLTLGYYHVIPTGFQFGGAEKVEGAVKGKVKG